MARSPARAPRRPRRGERDVVAAVLDAAEELLGERGLDLTVADVISAAGVSRGSFYFYFESKEAVVAALLEQIIDEVHDASLPWLDRGTRDPELALRSALSASLALWRRHGPVLRSAVELWQAEPAIRDLWASVLERFTGAAAAQIELDREAGVAPPGPPARSLAAVLVAMNERSFYYAVLEPDTGSDEELVKTLVTVWLAAIYGGGAATA